MKGTLSLLVALASTNTAAEEMYNNRIFTKSSKKGIGSKTPKASAKSTKSTAAAENISSAKNTTSTFIWFTDVHYDQYYGTSQAAFHGGPHPSCPGYEENHCNNTDSPKYSIYGCGASRDLVESFISEAARVTNGKPDFILFTGDATRHFADDLKDGAISTVHDAVSYIHNTTKEHFPDVPVYQLPTPVLGNNDWSPHDTVNYIVPCMRRG